MEKFEKILEDMESIAEKSSLAATNAQLTIETISELYKEKEIKLIETQEKEREALHKHYGRIIVGLILTLVILLGSIIGGSIYLFTNYDFGIVTYQDMDIGGSGNQDIHDGIHYNTAN